MGVPFLEYDPSNTYLGIDRANNPPENTNMAENQITTVQSLTDGATQAISTAVDDLQHAARELVGVNNQGSQQLLNIVREIEEKADQIRAVQKRIAAPKTT